MSDETMALPMWGMAGVAARAQEAQQEEEEMSSYSTRDLAEDWEFKIMRSPLGRFGRQDVLRRMLEEEARAGWVLVEKFDDSRVRLKRPASARAGDASLDLDAYRTGDDYGTFRRAFVISFLVGTVLLGVALYLLMTSVLVR